MSDSSWQAHHSAFGRKNISLTFRNLLPLLRPSLQAMTQMMRGPLSARMLLHIQMTPESAISSMVTREMWLAWSYNHMGVDDTREGPDASTGKSTLFWSTGPEGLSDNHYQYSGSGDFSWHCCKRHCTNSPSVCHPPEVLILAGVFMMEVI